LNHLELEGAVSKNFEEHWGGWGERASYVCRTTRLTMDVNYVVKDETRDNASFNEEGDCRWYRSLAPSCGHCSVIIRRSESDHSA